MHLLLITDDEFQSHVIVGAAMRRDFTVESALTAGGASDLLRPDAVIVDCEMTDAAALERVRAVSARDPKAHIFVIAEQISELGRERLAAMNVREVREKPFYVNDLLTSVQATARPERRRANSPMRGADAAVSAVSVSARSA